ncbi:norepinephrine/norepinephrine transporter, putative [Ixodes scapularis]|uniref:Transporter n=1 Tax=Ixodes scapularis TaxID=6945 RepID=B7PMD1_IXOSC|nr:norepinephrine/norepinephrine transporter, putative [Ixodes scapularis]|eukprot:XP_002434929.1 norepinephrine/norepinephrine transporter, putative [Ixodes scapularis]
MPTNNSSLVPKSEQLQQQQEQRNSAAGQPLIPAAGSVTEEYQESLEGGSKTSSPLPDSDKRGPAFRPLVHQPQSKESPLIFEKSKLKRLRHSAIRDDGYCSSSSTPLSSEYVDHLGSTEGQTEVILADGVASTVPIVVDAKAADSKGGSVVPSGPHDSGDRPTWKNKADFLLSIIGFAVDLANVWRFPYLCYRNGGGVFLIPYLLMLVFGALPLFYMELVLGQYNRQGPISVWKLCPLFKGVGYCSVLVSWYVSFYYNVIIGWALYFMFSSFRAELPWARCGNPWNTPSCYSGTLDDNGTVQDDSMPIENRTSPALEFFNRAVLELHTSPGMHDLGVPKWQLLLCVMLVFVILYLALFKGVSSSGKVVWVTATAPYVILTLLLLRGVLLPGAGTGVKYYLQPNVDKLLETQVWVDAAVQVFYSVGVGFGVHLTYASYNPFHNNCYRDCLMTTAVNSFTSFYSGFVIFVYLGYMAAKQGVPIQTVATEGHGLVFQVYPEAIATLPGAPIWAVLFFIMLLTLGLDSAMGGLESVITGLMDEFKPFFSRWRCRREVFTAVVICASFCVSIVNVTRGGGYMITWFDTYSAGISLLCSALFESIGIAWFYGLDRFCGNINEMLGFRPGIFWRLCWKFITPTFLVAVILSGIVNQAPVEYHNYRYPTWAINMGWGLALSSVAMVPIVAAFKLCRAKGTCAELSHWTYV